MSNQFFDQQIFHILCMYYFKYICENLPQPHLHYLVLYMPIVYIMFVIYIVCVCGPGKPYFMRTKCPQKNGNIRNPCPLGDFFFLVRMSTINYRL